MRRLGASPLTEEQIQVMSKILVINVIVYKSTSEKISEEEEDYLTQTFNKHPAIWENLNSAASLQLYCKYATNQELIRQAELKTWKLMNQKSL